MTLRDNCEELFFELSDEQLCDWLLNKAGDRVLDKVRELVENDWVEWKMDMVQNP
jgi:hypothetical protein